MVQLYVIYTNVQSKLKVLEYKNEDRIVRYDAYLNQSRSSAARLSLRMATQSFTLCW